MGTLLTKNQLRRLPNYLHLLKNLKTSGMKYISCQTIADCLDLNKEQVRKDIALISSTDGVPNKGREVSTLINDIETILGYKTNTNAVLIGAGSLGTALCYYKGFENYGLNIVAAFDKYPSNIGKKVGNVPLFNINELDAKFLAELNAEIGIICVPDKFAQEVADQLIKTNIQAIWNLAPTKINAPKEIIVLDSDLASALAVLSHELYLKKQEEK